MILPEDRYRFSGKKKRNLKPLIVIIACAFVAVAAVVIILLNGNPIDKGLFGSEKEEETKIETLWENQHYETINQICEVILNEDPMNQKALIYNGFSYFYRGASQYSLEEKIPLFDNAIVNLRKALLISDENIRGKVKYIMGKSYYQKGKFYSDLSIKYLEESIEDGYTGDDTFEYLGLLYSRIGKYQKSADYYKSAIEDNPTDMLYLVMAQTYYQLGNIEDAEEYLIWTLNKTDDFSIEQKARYLLGNILIEKEEYSKAEEEYKKILEKNEKAADAHYYLGDIYDRLGDSAKARYEWRKCLEIDSYHYGARLKLYG